MSNRRIPTRCRCNELEHQRDLLAEALGDLLATLGVTNPDMPLTGPELLMAAEAAQESPLQDEES